MASREAGITEQTYYRSQGDKVSFEYVPLLPTGTCIVAGLLANVPIVVDILKSVWIETELEI